MKDDSISVYVEGEPLGDLAAPRKRARDAFLAPFDSLLSQIEAAREVDAYPFYSALDASSAANAGSDPLILVANDYLGLASDKRVREAARRAISELGTSRCSSPLAGGHTDLHRTLEQRIASFLGQESAVIFASGYQANVGIVSALMRKGDLVLTDLFDHASIVDGARLSGAEVRFFQHNSPAHLERILSRDSGGRRILVIVEGIYSADGDIARLPEICAVSHAHGALVMIDEAHSLGVLGRGGRGAAEHFDMLAEVDLFMGTMSKSLASVGGFMAADRRLVDAVAHSARSLIFSAALPPAGAAAALAAIDILESEPERRERLWCNARVLLDGLNERGFDTMGSVTPVIPIRTGDAALALAFSDRLRARGIFVCPAIPPMVPAPLSRVRAHVTASHTPERLRAALAVIEEEGRALKIGRVGEPVAQVAVAGNGRGQSGAGAARRSADQR